jgi:hypothetical protein
MWTANLDKVEKDPTNGNIIAHVTFTDGVLTIASNDIRGNDLTIDTIEVICALRIRAYEERDAAFALLTSKVGPVSLVVPPEPDALTLALQKLSALKQKVNLGVKTEDDSDYVEALTTAKQLQADADSN